MQRIEYAIAVFRGSQLMSGYRIDARWACRKDKSDWMPDHLPSGRSTGAYRTRADAVAVAQAITKRYGVTPLLVASDPRLPGLRIFVDHVIARRRRQG